MINRQSLNKKICIFLLFEIFIILNKNIILSVNNNDNYQLNGIYIINSISSNLFFSIQGDILTLTNFKSHFRFILIESNTYFIESRITKKRIGTDEFNNIKIYNKKNNLDNVKLFWNIIKINQNIFTIKNKYNQKYLISYNNKLEFENNPSISLHKKTNNNISLNYLFNFLKIFEEGKFKKKYLKYINKEPIDVVIKYIDLTDKTLKREGIIQIYKDKENEELKYCIRSIITYIPWVRKIYIIMPNEKVKFFKSLDEIKEKIIYIKDRDLLGFDSANIHSFTFNLYKMEKFGISKNFIYMEDDFFIGCPLKKKDFFFYDEYQKKVFPYLLTYFFNIINETSILNDYNAMLDMKDIIHPHSGEGWKFSVLSTQKYFMENYKPPIINSRFTHNAIAENINDLKEIFEEIKNYKYINETLFSKERHFFTLNQPQFYNLYLLNIKHRKVNSIPYKYIPIEYLNKYNLNIDLFVINTGGNHKPLKRHYLLQRKIMEKIDF